MQAVYRFCKFTLGIMICLITLFDNVSILNAQEAVSVEALTILTQNRRINISVEIADTDEEREVGLMFRKSLPPYSGMLFNYEKPKKVAMWMKNTFISLDILFIDKNGIILNIAQNTVPQSLTSIPSHGAALGVLEVKAGTTKALMIAPGDQVIHELFQNVIE